MLNYKVSLNSTVTTFGSLSKEELGVCKLNMFTVRRYFRFTYVSLQLRVQNAVSAQPCVGKFRISLVLLNFLHCNFRLWFETT